MRFMFMLLLSTGCARVCGSGEYLVVGEDAPIVDTDGDGYAEAYFKCGVLWDGFGLRSATHTTFTWTPSLDARRQASFDVESIYGPASQLTVPNDALEVGAELTPTEGSGSHIIYLDDRFTRATVPVGTARIEVLGQRGGGSSVSETASNAEEWRLAWEATFVDPQDPSTVIQRIEGEDWLEVSDE